MTADDDPSAKSGLTSGRPTSYSLRRRRFGRTILFFLLVLTLTITQPHLYTIIRTSSTRSSSFERSITKEGHVEAAATKSTRAEMNQEFAEMPLFYHISPGSTGSRTLYHAACNAGFPSVHHKSFCISSNRGVNGVPSKVVEGVRAHLQVLRLYQIAYKCCSYWKKGIIIQDNSGSGKIVMKEDGEEDGAVILDLCAMSLDDWARDIQTYLSTVLQSSIVGLFDTPYPLMATQVLELTAKLRDTPPIIAMTERDEVSWAKSRSRNHNLMLCKKEFSYEELGASEFDIIGCVERARSSTMDTQGGNKSEVLHFWDVFEYRSRFDEVGDEFRKGLERQMEHHQSIYRPIADYTPNFFGSSVLNESEHTPTPKRKVVVTEKQVKYDIQRLVLLQKGRGGGMPSESVNNTQTTLLSKKLYKKPLTCRGSVQYEILNDTFTELYDHPKACDLNVEKVQERINLVQN